MWDMEETMLGIGLGGVSRSSNCGGGHHCQSRRKVADGDEESGMGARGLGMPR